jgi:trimethylamine--corrinoid protein Co-methyltransferase
MAEAESRRRTRRSGRAARASSTVPQLPWRQPANPYRPVEVIDADKVEAIHRASMRVLKEIGVKVLDARARGLLGTAGADVDHASMMVRFDPDMVMEKVALAPSEFILRARNPERDLKIGGNNVIFASTGGPAFYSDLPGGRRTGTYAEMCDFIKAVHSLNIIHQEGGGPFEAMDLPAETRHLDLYLADITLTDKNWQPWGLGHDRASDAIDMTCLAMGLSREQLAEQPFHTCIINTNSPLVIDGPMAEGLIEFATWGQAVIVTPFTLAGAMSPVTIAGALVQQNVEALAGIVLAQCVRAGTPVVYGSFTSNVNMRTGSPAFGTPEYALAAQASAQLARRYGLPLRSSNVTTSNAVDAQAAYESEMALWGAIMGHCNILAHAAGWLSGGLTASLEKLIIDAEMLQMFAVYLQSFDVDDAALGFDAIKDVGPGGHFFGTAHTLERYETAFYTPLVSEWDNYENWVDRGSKDAAERAHAVATRLIAEYEKPAIDPEIEAALRAFVDRRKKEIAARD